MKVECEFSDFQWHDGEQIYTCKIPGAAITNKLEKIKCFEGVHEPRKSNEDVKGLWFHNSSVHYVPRDVYKHFPNLTHFGIYKCGLKEVTKQDLRGLEGLVNLKFTNNQLTSLPDNLFYKMPNLRIVELWNNKIEFASSKLLEPLIGRANVKVNLQGNTNINSLFAPGESESLNSLEELMQMIDEKCQKPAISFEADNSHETFDELIKDMWTSGRLSDFTIIADTKQFKVHRIILGIRSSVLAKIIEDHKDAAEIKIHDFTPKAVEALLHFIYTGETQDNENAKENFSIASKFEIAKMKSIYEEILCDQLNELDAYEIFLLAHKHSANTLKERAFNVIADKGTLFGSDLPFELMENPEKLKKVIDMRREYEKLLKE